MTENEPRLVLDMDVLASGERSDAYWVCDGLFAALARSKRLRVAFAASPQRLQGANDYLRTWEGQWSAEPVRARQPGSTEIVLCPPGVAPSEWRDDPFALRAHFICDLAPLIRPQSFSGELVRETQAMVAGLDARTVVLALAGHVKEDLLQLRPDLSPAQITVIPSASNVSMRPCELRSKSFDWNQSAALVEDALLDAYMRYAARPASMLWQFPSERPVDPSMPASFLGFANGAFGPDFDLPPRVSASEWPRWSDALASGEARARVEGGLRATGVFKTSTDEEPLVSYVTVVRNNVATLGRAIESVQRQTYRNVEHIVVDGASSDGTVDLILRHAARLDYFVSEPDRGLYDAINKAVPLARGELICVLNSDDWLEPHAAEIAVRRMRGKTRRAALLATGAVIYNLEGGVEVEWPPMFVHPGSYFACANICHNGVYATRLAYERSGPYDTTFRIAADFKWVMACLDAGVEFAYTREVCVNYSLGGTSGDAAGHSRECRRVVAERFPFLARDEVLGLYDCYFLFGHQPHDEPVQRSETPTMFLRRLFAEHANRADLRVALAWAAMTKLVYPIVEQSAPAAAVRRAPSIRRLAKDRIKGLLHRYPRLYDAARWSYGRMRR